MKEIRLHIGCSSYNTASWKNLFYPEDLPKKKWFEFYCQHFNTYEFNGSFYKFPTVENLLLWYDKTPEDFLFSMKVPRIITHIKKLKNTEKEIEDFYQICKEGLKSKLACILWQFPPGFDFSEEKLELLMNSFDPGIKNVIEFRHQSWWRKEVIVEFQRSKLIFCNVNYPHLPTEIMQTVPTGYIRMHGNPKLFYSQYTNEEIKSLYAEINSCHFDEVFIYFNNTASTAGIINALQFKQVYEGKTKV